MNIINYIIILSINLFTKTPSEEVLFYTNHKYIHIVIYMGAFLILTYIFYLFIHNKLKLEKSILSFITFGFFFLVFFLYVRSFIFISARLNEPFYLNDLTLIHYYKYVLLSSIVVLFICFWILSFFFRPVKKFLEIISYPYVKEEIRLILYSWKNNFMAPFCVYLYKKIYNSEIFSCIYFIIHFFIFYVIRCITAVLFFNFALFNGDLTWLFYFLPLSLIVWILSFIDYYFQVFREGTKNFLEEILLVQYKKDLTFLQEKKGFVYTDLSNFDFILLPNAKKEGFNCDDLEFLKSKWHISAVVSTKFRIYEDSLKLFKIFILFILCVSWFIISYKFFYNDSKNFILTFPFIFRRFPLSTAGHKFMRSPREVWFVKEGHSMNHVKKETEGAVSPGHAVIGEVEGSELRVDAAVTHGQGKPPHLSQPLSSKGVPPDKKPLNVIAMPNGPKKIDKTHFNHRPLKNSEQFCEQSSVKNILDELVKKFKEDSQDS